jgi:hypothetical protein
MNRHRFWIEILVLGTLIACALALLIATLGLAAGAAVSAAGGRQASASTGQSYEGMVTCSRCGAKHSAAMARTATSCARMCVKAGARFELVQADSTYLLEGNLEELTRVAGQRARIVGSLNGDTITVASVAPDAS